MEYLLIRKLQIRVFRKVEPHNLYEGNQALPGRPGLLPICHDNNKPLIKTVPNVLLMLLQVSRTVRDDLHLQGSYPRLIGHYRQILFIWMNFNQINFATVLPIRKQTIFVFTLKPVRWYAIRSWGSHNGILI